MSEAEVIGRLAGKVLNTPPGRFIEGVVLGVFVLNALFFVFNYLALYLIKLLHAVPFVYGWLTRHGLPDNVLAIGIALFLAVSAGSLILCFLFRRWPKIWIVSLIPPLVAFGFLVFICTCRATDTMPNIFGLNPLFILACVLYAPFAIGCGIRLAMGMRTNFGEGKFIRGTDKLKGNERNVEQSLSALSQKENRACPKGTTIWQKVDLPYPKENQGIVIIGSPGSGKTQTTFPIIEQVIGKKQKAIIWDLKGGYIQALANDPGVSLLAPWDSRSIKWRPGADIIRPLDCHQASHMLIPINPREPQPYFNNAARNILEAVLIQLDAAQGSWGWQDVWTAITQSQSDLADWLQQSVEGRSAAATIEGDSKSGQDVYSTLISQLKPVSWLAKAWGNEGISLRAWLKDPSSKTLIIGGMVENEELAALTARLTIQILVNELLAMPDDLNRRVWLFLDELAALGSCESLLKAFTTGRSKGLCVVAGIQDIGRIEHLYSHELAKSIINTFSTHIFLRCTDTATSQWASEAIGYQETFDLVGETISGDMDKSKNKNVRHKPVFMGSEIANFPDLTGVLRVTGWPVAKVTWPLKPIPQKYPRVVDAGWVNKKAVLDATLFPGKNDADQNKPNRWGNYS